jgi:hypothetical protein
MNPFEFVNAVTHTKQDLMKEDVERFYQPFLVNRALSYFPDTVMYANEMNIHNNIDSKLQFHFFLNTLRPAKRFAKWVKKEEDNDLTAIMEYYGYGLEKAKQALSVLSSEQLIIIKQKLEKGGQL